jgi:hypothetical protein
VPCALRPGKHQTVQVDVEIGGRAKALDQRDGTALAFVTLQRRVVQQMPLDHALVRPESPTSSPGRRLDWSGQRWQPWILAALPPVLHKGDLLVDGGHRSHADLRSTLVCPAAQVSRYAPPHPRRWT